MGNRTRRLWLVGLGALVLIGGAVVTVKLSGDDGPPPLTTADVNRTASSIVEQALKKQASKPTAGSQVYKAVLPSLVVITVERVDGSEPAPSDSADSADGGAVGSGRGISLGAGVVVSAEGSILTSNHVVDGADTIVVTFSDGTRSSATITNSEPENDIAVLAPDRLPGVIVPAVLGGGVSIGDDVYAIGNPLGLTFSISGGVVSGLDRSVPVNPETTLEGLIQFDAAVNPGNSGGPLLNRAGQVVGIVTALANPAKQDFFTGIGFAVTIKAAGGAAGGPQQ